MPSPTGYGEGGQYLAQAMPDVQGNFSFTLPMQSDDAPLSTAVANGDHLTVTATDIAGNTSEFSPNFIIGIGDAILPNIVLLTPNGGEAYNAGDLVTIRWRSFDNVGVVAQDVLFSTDSGHTFRVLRSNLAGAVQEFQVQLPVVIDTAQAKICVVARDGNGNESRDCSDDFFVVLGATTSRRRSAWPRPTGARSSPPVSPTRFGGMPATIDRTCRVPFSSQPMAVRATAH
jgi:hypothetical protein